MSRPSTQWFLAEQNPWRGTAYETNPHPASVPSFAPHLARLPAAVSHATGLEASAAGLPQPTPPYPLVGPRRRLVSPGPLLVQRRLPGRALRDRPRLLRRLVPQAPPARPHLLRLSEGPDTLAPDRLAGPGRRRPPTPGVSLRLLLAVSRLRPHRLRRHPAGLPAAPSWSSAWVKRARTSRPPCCG